MKKYDIIKEKGENNEVLCKCALAYARFEKG